MWEPRRLTALCASTAIHRASFTFLTFPKEYTIRYSDTFMVDNGGTDAITLWDPGSILVGDSHVGELGTRWRWLFQ
jgi:hypothetical protein